MLSPTCGMRAQTFRMEVKIRAFLAAGMCGGEVMGRNSATGSPRRSITITPPSEASRTSSEVWMWSSRTEVFLMCYIVAPWSSAADLRRAQVAIARGRARGANTEASGRLLNSIVTGRRNAMLFTGGPLE